MGESLFSHEIAQEKIKLFSDLPLKSWLLLPETPLLGPLLKNHYLWNSRSLPHATFTTSIPSPRRPYQIVFNDTHYNYTLEEEHHYL